MSSEVDDLKVDVRSLNMLLELNLSIPSYQRPYTWSRKNIDKMIEDFIEHMKENENLDYYMGTILLHHDKNEYKIIDGQQRITTLLLLLKLYEIQYFRDLEYDNPKTHNQIKMNFEYLKEIKLNFDRKIFEQLKFTVIITQNEDDAFTFFDTQNNRGVQPSVLVLLKAYHLRSNMQKSLQIECAKLWETEEKHKDVSLYEEKEKLEWLIKIFFYRVRYWREARPSFGNYDEFRDKFTKKLRKAENEKYKLFVDRSIQKILTEENEIVIKPRDGDGDWFSLSIRQPIYQGEGFFKFVSYYGKLLTQMMKEDVYKKKKFEELQEVHATGSKYMGSFLTMICLTYYDRFGKNGFQEFVKELNILIANIRLESSRILKQTLEKEFIRCESDIIQLDQSILNFLCTAYDVQEALEWIGENEKIVISSNEEGIKKRFNDKYIDFWGAENE